MNSAFREINTQPYFAIDSNINFPVHIHDDMELVYVIEGSGTAFCDGKHYTLSANSIFLVFPEQIHSYSGFTDGSYILLVINPSRLLYVEEILRNFIPENAHYPADRTTLPLFQNALDEFCDQGDSYVVDGYLTALLGKLFQRIPLQRNTSVKGIVSQILQYCSQHCQDDLRVQDLCQHLHLSRSYISHLFRERLKISFPEYMNALRLNRALPLLRDSMLTMTQVAERAGFSTIRTFNRVFRKQFGCAPSEYRKQHETNR